MQARFLLLTFVVFLQHKAISGQTQWVLPSTTAAEMRNPYTWYWPYAMAASEAYRNYFENAQQITNQLYQQAYATQAFPWTSNNGGSGLNSPLGGGEAWNGRYRRPSTQAGFYG